MKFKQQHLGHQANDLDSIIKADADRLRKYYRDSKVEERTAASLFSITTQGRTFPQSDSISDGFMGGLKGILLFVGIAAIVGVGIFALFAEDSTSGQIVTQPVIRVESSYPTETNPTTLSPAEAPTINGQSKQPITKGRTERSQPLPLVDKETTPTEENKVVPAESRPTHRSSDRKGSGEFHW